MARIQFRIAVKSWIRIRIETNADPKHWINLYLSQIILRLIKHDHDHDHDPCVDYGTYPNSLQDARLWGRTEG